MKAIHGAMAVLLLLVSGLGHAESNSSMQIAITFDDLPLHNDLPPGVTRQQVAKDIIHALQAARAPKVYGFINAVHLQNDRALGEVLSDWHAAGFPLGNHTWTHASLNSVSIADYTDELLKNETTLALYSKGMAWNWFRYPYLAEANDPEKRKAVRALLSQHGYHIAAVTMSFGDYMWNGPYARCAAEHDETAIKLLEKSYMLAVAAALRNSHQMSTALYGRDIPYVLLMHMGGFDARMLPQVLAFYNSQGVKLITLEQAQQDEVYNSDFDPALPAEPSGLEARMMARGLAVPRSDSALTSMLDNICK